MIKLNNEKVFPKVKVSNNWKSKFLNQCFLYLNQILKFLSPVVTLAVYKH